MILNLLFQSKHRAFACKRSEFKLHMVSDGIAGNILVHKKMNKFSSKVDDSGRKNIYVDTELPLYAGDFDNVSFSFILYIFV